MFPKIYLDKYCISHALESESEIINTSQMRLHKFTLNNTRNFILSYLLTQALFQ